MKKLLFIAAICMLSLNISAERDLPSLPSVTLESLEKQQTSSWEYLGDIQGVSEELSGSYTVKLYVRIIGEREFYQVRYNNTTGPQTSAVTFGNFFCKGKKYNAKFIVDFLGAKYSHYFNL